MYTRNVVMNQLQHFQGIILMTKYMLSVGQKVVFVSQMSWLATQFAILHMFYHPFQIYPQAGPCGLMDKAPDFGSGDCRFESCHGRILFPQSLVMNIRIQVGPNLVAVVVIKVSGGSIQSSPFCCEKV